jgi:hypothetical protein
MRNSQNIQELTNEINDSNQFTHQAIIKMEEEINYLVAEFNIIEEEEFQSQLMVRGHYMIDEDDASNYCHEHVPATTILESEEIVDNNEQVEHTELVEPPANTSLSNDKEVSTESYSFIIVPFETHHKPKLQFFNVSKSHCMPRFSRIYADMRTNLGIIILRKYFQASKLGT